MVPFLELLSKILGALDPEVAALEIGQVLWYYALLLLVREVKESLQLVDVWGLTSRQLLLVVLFVFQQSFFQP